MIGYFGPPEVDVRDVLIAELTAERDALAQENKRLVEALENIAQFANSTQGQMAIRAIATVKEKP